MTVGSVRGKERLEIPFLVAQGGRSVGVAELVLPIAPDIDAMSFGGHVRFVPALMDSVGWPHWAQNGLRLFQSMRARACAYMAADGAGRFICIRPSTKVKPSAFLLSINDFAASVIVPLGVTSKAKKGVPVYMLYSKPVF